MIVISVDGMTCENCVRHVKEALEGLTGVTAVEVSLEEGEARVQASGALPERLNEKLIRETLDEEGYEVTAVVETES
jgi:copper chaperone CopZ